MDYQPPHLCIRSMEPVPGKPGWVLLDMPSVYDTSPQRAYPVREWVVDALTREPYPVVMCPPNWPNPPQ